MASIFPAVPKTIHDPAERLDLSYAFANNLAVLGRYDDPLREMSEVAKEVVPGIPARCALSHPAEIARLVQLLARSSVRPEVLIDFPDGLGGAETKEIQARLSRQAGAVGGDIVLNLHAVQARDKATLLKEFQAVRQHLSEAKAIAQIPYLWEYDRDAIPWLLEILSEAGVYCIKDWTTRENFLLPAGKSLDFSDATRIEYVKFMREYIEVHTLPLIIKVAGRVEAGNVRSFVDAGATLIGLGYRKAAALREALLGH